MCLHSLLWAQGSQSPAPLLASSPQAPESFYVVAREKDSWTIVDVQPASGLETRVRFIRVRRACGSYRIDEAEFLFENLSVAQLTAEADVCVREDAVTKVIRSAGKKDLDLWGEESQGIVALCGTQKRAHELAPVNSLRFSQIQTGMPRTAALWTLAQRVRERFVKETGHEVFQSVPWELRPAEEREQAKAAAVEIRNGDFDLAAPRIPEDHRADDRSKLSEVMPDPQEATAPEVNFGDVSDDDIPGILIHKVMIAYPQMAIIAHISGDVAVDVSIDQDSGRVTSAVAKTGHPILQQAATDAIRQWVIGRYRGPNPLSLTVHFQYNCAPLIETEKADVWQEDQETVA
jgi:TonB family protein